MTSLRERLDYIQGIDNKYLQVGITVIFEKEVEAFQKEGYEQEWNMEENNVVVECDSQNGFGDLGFDVLVLDVNSNMIWK